MRKMLKAAVGRAGVIAAVLLALVAFAPQAEALDANGGTVSYIGSGDVTITFVESDADFRSFLVLYTASDLTTALTPAGTPCGGCPSGGIFNSDTTPVGTVFVLDEAFLQANFAAGDEMVFAIQVDEDLNGTIDNTYFMGAAARNSDGIFHNDTKSGGPQLALVGFEDLLGGGDVDYNDHIFSFFPVIFVPNPGGLVLVGVGLLGFALADWKRRRR